MNKGQVRLPHTHTRTHVILESGRLEMLLLQMLFHLDNNSGTILCLTSVVNILVFI